LNSRKVFYEILEISQQKNGTASNSQNITAENIVHSHQDFIEILKTSRQKIDRK
jgi:hypothetical protein